MRKFDVVIALEKVAEMRSTWSASKRTFDESVNQIMTRLLHEAAQSYMSPEEVASACGLKVAQVRSMMRLNGLDPKKGKTLLAKTAAEALANNADLLGISVHDMDLMSPLAYLPMGDQMKRDLTEAGVHTVTELPDDPTPPMYQEDSDEFNPDYLAYLGTLTSEAGEGKWRITRDPEGQMVRFEVWLNDNTYLNFPIRTAQR
jgi:hypothetical protein